MEKSKVVSVYAKRNFKFLGFALGKGKDGIYIRTHAKSLKKAKEKLRELTSRSQGRNVRKVMENTKVFARGWVGYFGIASMRNTMKEWDEWLRRRFRMVPAEGTGPFMRTHPKVPLWAASMTS